MKIAFFDSGIGGLSVLQEALQLMPNEQYIYFADSKNTPYGTKTGPEIEALVLNAVAFLAKHELKALVLACNTATSVVVKKLRTKYDFPIIGMEPAVKPAVENSPDKKSLICATEQTLKAAKLQELIKTLDAKDRVQKLSLQELVVFAERFEFDGPNVIEYLAEQFAEIDWSTFDSIVLGCTHFLFYKKQIRAAIPNHIRLLDGNLGTVRHLRNNISETSARKKTAIEYYISGKPAPAEYFERYFSFLKKNATPRLQFQSFPKLTTKRLLLRRLLLKDSKSLFAMLTDQKNRQFIEAPPIRFLKEAKQFIRVRNKGVQNNQWIFWAITLKNDPTLIGTITLWNFNDMNDQAEVGFELQPHFQKKGIMQEALTAVLNYGFQHLKLTSIQAFTHIENKNAQRLIERNQFKKIEIIKDPKLDRKGFVKMIKYQIDRKLIS